MLFHRKRFFIILIFVTSCSYVNRKNILLGQWQLVDTSLEYSHKTKEEVKDTLKKAIPKRKQKYFNTFYNFKADGTYTLKVGNNEDTGTWLLSNNENVLIIRSNQNAKNDGELLIKELNEFSLVLVSEIADKREILKFKPLR